VPAPTIEGDSPGAESIGADGPPAAPTIEAEVPGKKLSAIDAAAKVLGEEGRPMNCQEMIDAMAAKGYWQSPGGKTPAATLYASILREQKVRGAEARFVKAQRGRFERARLPPAPPRSPQGPIQGPSFVGSMSVGSGRVWNEAAVAQGHEGVTAGIDASHGSSPRRRWTSTCRSVTITQQVSDACNSVVALPPCRQGRLLGDAGRASR
jgi:hypothetical protein